MVLFGCIYFVKMHNVNLYLNQFATEIDQLHCDDNKCCFYWKQYSVIITYTLCQAAQRDSPVTAQCCAISLVHVYETAL